jgi:hypothetical protein
MQIYFAHLASVPLPASLDKLQRERKQGAERQPQGKDNRGTITPHEVFNEMVARAP